MNEKNQIKLFRDPLDPRELSFGLSQPHVQPSLTSGTGQSRIPNDFMKNENQISGGDRTLRQSMKSIKQDLAEWVKDQQVIKAVSKRDVTHAHYGTPCSKTECDPRLKAKGKQ